MIFGLPRSLSPGAVETEGRCSSFGENGRSSSTRRGSMSGVRLLVGTRKGAFVLTSDGTRDEWNFEGPMFAGWEIDFLNASPVDHDRVVASHSTGWCDQDMVD